MHVFLRHSFALEAFALQQSCYSTRLKMLCKYYNKYIYIYNKYIIPINYYIHSKNIIKLQTITQGLVFHMNILIGIIFCLFCEDKIQRRTTVTPQVFDDRIFMTDGR